MNTMPYASYGCVSKKGTNYPFVSFFSHHGRVPLRFENESAGTSITREERHRSLTFSPVFFMETLFKDIRCL
jgi:hypothetical protein